MCCHKWNLPYNLVDSAKHLYKNVIEICVAKQTDIFILKNLLTD